jgi:hypothetical protein
MKPLPCDLDESLKKPCMNERKCGAGESMHEILIVQKRTNIR